MGELDDYELLSSEVLFRGRVLTVRLDDVRMSDGTTARRELVEHPGAVAVVALDEENRVVLVNQYRHPVRARLDELPAGLLDVAGEPALAAAQRELVEEAGLAARDWHVLLDLQTSPGMTNEAVRVFLARGLSAADTGGFRPEHEEAAMTVSREPLAEAIHRVLSGGITNAIAVAGLLAAVHGRATEWRDLRPADAPWPGRVGQR
ncbi:ADP-ribose pyrophosphatase [Jatrophihabitans endophyticus]|uniref:ADP-ribose pyrophosphatase n=1 Tax=Jatrophihabitans endophyticus TaxID=1206085 RepID=A0A1M5MRE9_9ACTN|nr:NUDIX hydrolase [Jatrophihabitans endophyticus]SHG79363.1 ADP-ribose pyrophosphatase [Jatrophihabitans endophyticus]